MLMHAILYRCVAQLVERLSPKEEVVGSIPTAPANTPVAQSGQERHSYKVEANRIP